MFISSVVIDKHNAASDVDILLYIRVPDVRQMGCLASVSHGGVLHLHKVPYLTAATYMAIGTEVSKGANLSLVAHGAFQDHRTLDLRTVAYSRVYDTGVLSDNAVFSYGYLPFQNCTGVNDRAFSDLHPLIDICLSDVDEPDAFSA